MIQFFVTLALCLLAVGTLGPWLRDHGRYWLWRAHELCNWCPVCDRGSYPDCGCAASEFAWYFDKKREMR